MLETFFAMMLLLAATAAFPVFVLVDTRASLRAVGLREDIESPRKPVQAHEIASTAKSHSTLSLEQSARKAS